MGRASGGLIGGLLGAANHVVRTAEREQLDEQERAREQRAEGRELRAEKRAMDRSEAIAKMQQEMGLNALNDPRAIQAETRKSAQSRADFVFQQNNQRFAPQPRSQLGELEALQRKADKGDVSAQKTLENFTGRSGKGAKPEQPDPAAGISIKPVKVPNPRGAAYPEVTSYALVDPKGGMKSKGFSTYEEAEQEMARLLNQRKKEAARGTVDAFTGADGSAGALNPLFVR